MWRPLGTESPHDDVNRHQPSEAREARDPQEGPEARALSSLSGGMLIFSALEGGVGNACFHPYAGAMIIFSRPSRGA